MNKYNDIRLNVSELIQEQTKRLNSDDPHIKSKDTLGFLGYPKSYLKLYMMRFLVRTGLYQKLVFSNLKLDWFYEFRRYWVEELGNRPLELPDFYFLYGSYRSRFSEISVPDYATDEQHLEAWQDYRSIFLLFYNQYKLALNPLVAQRFIKYIPKGGNVCEYGCGLAPISSSLCKYYLHHQVRISCADIPNILFHFTKWKFRNFKNVKLIPIKPQNDAPLSDTYDIVFCMAVLEHLPRPLSTLQHLYSKIKPGGYFVFDYVKSEGAGLDTATGLKDRLLALEYIIDHFNIIEGKVLLNGNHVGTTVCYKPN